MKAVNRVKATDGLLSCDITYSAVAACMSKDGAGILTKTRDALQERQHGK